MKFSVKYCKNKNRIWILYVAATALFVVAVFFGAMVGSTKVTFGDVCSAMKNGVVGAEERIFLYLRLPRIIGCLIVGAALSVAGAVIQNVFNNRLASPSIVGVNSGAGLAVTLCAALEIYGGWEISLFSFLGAFLAVILVSTGARKWGASRGTVILMGIALNSLLNAAADTVITFNPEVGMMSNDFRIGDFSAVTYAKLIPAGIIVCGVLFVLFSLSNELDILTMGEENARGLGLDTKKSGALFLVLAAFLAGSAVSIAGLLSFVGLIVPHATRRLGVTSSRHLLPLCALFGAGFVTVCDTIARTVFSPYEIPVGIIMAFLGAPFFVFILIKGKGGHGRV